MGRQCDPHGTWFEFTPRDVRAALANARKMLGRGLSVPCVWEHQGLEVRDRPRTPAELAEWKRRYAKFCFGHVAGARINDRGNLDLLHEVPDDRDAEQLAKTRFCSPKVYPSYSDSRGGTYRGATIAHVAATPTPVQYWQRPFELSQGSALYLSYTPPEGSTVADDSDDKGKKKGVDGGSDRGELGALFDALTEKGLNIPPEVKDIAGLIICIKSSPAFSGDAGAGDDLDLDAGAGDDLDLGDKGATTAGGGPPMMMSTTDRDPARRSQATAWALDERRDLKRRIEALHNTGRVDRPTARQLFRQSRAIEMSFTAEAEAVSPLHKRLAELEKRPANAVWKAEGRDLSATRVVGAPEQLTKGDQGAGTKEATEALLARIPGPPAKK